MSPIPFVSPDQIFGAANALAALAWLALAASPPSAPWVATVRMLAGRVVPLIFAVVYVVLFVGHGMAGGGYDSLAAVQRLMASPTLLTAAWLHYLAFDLFVGSWIAERAGSIGMPHWWVLPLLALTFLFGPAGLLAFVLLRAVWLRRRRGLPAGSSRLFSATEATHPASRRGDPT